MNYDVTSLVSMTTGPHSPELPDFGNCRGPLFIQFENTIYL